MPAHLLIYGRNATLVETRRWVLEKAGCKVATTLASDEAMELLYRQGIDLLILCHTLTTDERRAALLQARNLFPSMSKLILTTDVSSYAPRPNEAVLSAFVDPKTLIATVDTLTGQGRELAV